MSYDEQPDGDPHGECTAEIHRLEAELATLESQQSRDGEVIRKQDEEIARLTAERDAALAKVALAYGHLWHVNNEPAAPIPIYTPEKAAYEARKILRDMLTSEQRGDAINATQNVWGNAARKEGAT